MKKIILIASLIYGCSGEIPQQQQQLQPTETTSETAPTPTPTLKDEPQKAVNSELSVGNTRVSVTASESDSVTVEKSIEVQDVQDEGVISDEGVPTPTPTPTVQSIDTTPPNTISNLKTGTTQVNNQDTRTTTANTIYLSWNGGDDSESGILKWTIYQYELSSCAGSPVSIDVSVNSYSTNSVIDTTYSFKVKAVNTIGLETLSECSGDITRISTQTAITNTSVSINAGDTYSRSTAVTLTLSATNATELYVTNVEDCVSGGSWQTYTINKSWNLAQQNATATVFVKFRDSYNRESTCINDSITHDSIAPTDTSISITQINTTANIHVTLNLTATNADKMLVSNTGCSSGIWENFATTKAWTLAQTNALNQIYVKFRDIALNESECFSASKLHEDSQAPQGPLVHINWNPPLQWAVTGPEFTDNRIVTLLLTAADESDITNVAISNGTECTGEWETFSYNYLDPISGQDGGLQKSWTLAPTSGVAYVSAKFKDVSGNVSGCATSNIKVVAMATTSQIVAGAYHTCLLSASGHAKCTGRNDYGQLGYGYASSLGDANSIGKIPSTIGTNLANIDVGTDRTIRQLALGTLHTCALLDNDTVKCWGRSHVGQLGQGNTDTILTMGDSLPTVNLGSAVSEISAGMYHTCARMSTGAVKCWGQNSFAQLGIGNITNVGDTTNPVFTSVELGTNKTAIQISAGWQHTCALLNDHTAKCWGYNQNKQLGYDIANYTGDGTYMIGNQPNQLGDTLPAILVGAGKTINQIASGGNFACALINDGSVKCWGAFVAGQLGYQTDYVRTHGTGNNRPYIDFGPSSYSVAKVTTGYEHTCVITTSGLTKCWGTNSSGQLGKYNTDTIGLTNTMYDDTVFPFISLGLNRQTTAKQAIDISAGAYHSCAVFNDGTAKCWGGNGYGQLGVGSTNNLGDFNGEMGDFLPEI